LDNNSSHPYIPTPKIRFQLNKHFTNKLLVNLQIVAYNQLSRLYRISCIVCCCWILHIREVSILIVCIQHRSRLCGGLIDIWRMSGMYGLVWKILLLIKSWRSCLVSTITWDIRIVYNRASHSSLHMLDIRHIVNNRTLHTRQDFQLLINNKIFHTVQAGMGSSVVDYSDIPCNC
jgi:hypothetical protein